MICGNFKKIISTPIFENADIEQIASNTVWNIVLGVLPIKFEGQKYQIVL